MKKISICLLVLCFQFFAQAQNIDIKWGEAQDFNDGIVPIKILNVIDDDVYILKSSVQGHYYFDNFIEVVSKTTLKSKDIILLDTNKFVFSRKHTYLKSVCYGDYLYVFTLIKSDFSATKYYCTKFSIKTGEIVIPTVKLGEFKQEATSAIVIKDSHMSTFFSDGGKYLVTYTNLPNKNKENEKIQYTLLDTSLVLKETVNIELPYRDKDYTEIRYWVEDNGNLNILGSKRVDKKRPPMFVLFNHNIKTNEQSEINFPTPDGRLKSFDFYVDDNNLFYFGLYLNDQTKHLGFYMYEFDSKKATINSNVNIDFESAKNLSKLNSKFDDYINLNEYDLIKFIQPAKDSIILVLENQMNDQTTYLFNDILTFKASKDGTVHNVGRLLKKQTFTSSDLWTGSSYQAIQMRAGLVSAKFIKREKNHFVIYNDHKDNININNLMETKATKFRKDAAVYLAFMDKNGNFKRNLLYYSETDNYLYSSDLNFYISKNELFVMGVYPRKKLFKYAILTVQE